MKLTKVIDRETLENIFVTAIEGGSNYWYFLSDDAVKSIREAVPREKNPYLSTAILEAILDHNVCVPINDCENEEDIVGVITKSTMLDRLQLLYESPHKWALERELSGDGDADSSDVCFQYMAMGEIVYG